VRVERQEVRESESGERGGGGVVRVGSRSEDRDPFNLFEFTAFAAARTKQV